MASDHTQIGKAGEQNHASSDHEEAAPEHGEFETVANPSQTLPLITEELTATHTTDHPIAPAPSTTSHVTTPVLPPNPIRRDGGQGQATRTESTANHNVATAVSQATADSEKNTGRQDTDDQTAKKEKSGGGVSATQLLAGAAAAATSSVIGGQLGVAGTVVGAGVASIITGLAVTLYTSSLDKGKKKFKEVGSKLGPAVKAKSLGNRTPNSTGLAAGPAGSPFGALSSQAAKLPSSAPADAEDPSTDAGSGSKSWWQKLRRKRVLYPVTIGVATFGIGLGAVVMAESFTDADLSPGTSQISRSVSGNSGTVDESGTSQDGGANSDSGSSGADSQPGRNSNPGSGNENSTSSEGQSTSASEGGSHNSSTTDQTGTDQGTDTNSSDSSSATSSSDASGSSSAGADTSGNSSSGGSSSSGAQDGGGSSSNGGSSSSTGSSDGAGSGSGSGSSTGGSTAAVQG